MMERSGNYLSGSVTGPVVQAGAIYGDVNIGTTGEDSSRHTRELWEERVSAHRAFLTAADEFAQVLLEVGELLRSSLNSGDASDWNEAQIRASTLSSRGDEVLKLYRSVTLVGPEGVSIAALAVCKQLDDFVKSLLRNAASKPSTSSWEEEDAVLRIAYEATLALLTIEARSHWECLPT